MTDWYYADLDSNWDTDNDGWYGEFLFCAPWVHAVPLSGLDLPGLCPAEGSALREGPYGTSASTSDDWSAEIALGRLPLNTREEVRQGILTVVRGEKSGSLVKRKALMAGAFWWYNGRSWNATTSSYDDGTGPNILGAWPGEGVRPYGSDNAEYLENLVRPAIDPYTTTITALYETTAPGGDATMSPTNRGSVSSAAINRANVLAAWNNDYGLVNLAGHGNNAGVYNESWVNDFNDNRILETPANPAESTGCTTNCNETDGFNAFIDYDFPNPGVIPAVVYAYACLTGDAWKNIRGAVTPWVARDDTLPARLIPSGAVAAWSGLLNLGATNTQEAHHAQYAGDILGKPLLLGDAQWKGNEALIRAYVWDWRRANQDLFGDPAYSYWGNPLDMRSPWPQSGGDWFANGASRLPGPVSALIEWTRSANNPQTSPIVTAGGSIVVGTSSGLAFYRANGTLEASPLTGFPVNCDPRGDHGRHLRHFRRQPVCLDPRTNHPLDREPGRAGDRRTSGRAGRAGVGADHSRDDAHQRVGGGANAQHRHLALACHHRRRAGDQRRGAVGRRRQPPDGILDGPRRARLSGLFVAGRWGDLGDNARRGPQRQSVRRNQQQHPGAVPGLPLPVCLRLDL